MGGLNGQRGKSVGGDFWQDVITHHPPGRTQRADRQRTEEERRCIRPEQPGGRWEWSHAGNERVASQRGKSHVEEKGRNKGRRGAWGGGVEREGPNRTLTAEYMMNLRGLPSSTAMEKLDRMAFSSSPGELAHRRLWCEWNYWPWHQKRLTLLRTESSRHGHPAANCAHLLETPPLEKNKLIKKNKKKTQEQKWRQQARQGDELIAAKGGWVSHLLSAWLSLGAGGWRCCMWPQRKPFSSGCPGRPGWPSAAEWGCESSAAGEKKKE